MNCKRKVGYFSGYRQRALSRYSSEPHGHNPAGHRGSLGRGGGFLVWFLLKSNTSEKANEINKVYMFLNEGLSNSKQYEAPLLNTEHGEVKQGRALSAAELLLAAG